MGHNKSTTMGWLSMSLLGILLACVNMQPLEFDVEKNEDIGEFLVDLFVADARNGRDLEVELDNNIEEDEMKDMKKRVEREATEIEEVGPLLVENMEETEDLVDRMGSVDKKNAKKGKSRELKNKKPKSKNKKTEMKNKNKGDKQKGAKNKN